VADAVQRSQYTVCQARFHLSIPACSQNANPTSSCTSKLVDPASLHALLPPPCRLAALPSVLQSCILRKAGHHTRRACTRWRDSYGPLDWPVTLDTPHSRGAVKALQLQRPDHFNHTTSLHLQYLIPRTISGQVLPQEADIAQPTITATDIPQSFPNLRALQFSKHAPLPANDLLHLGPLATCLTALHLPFIRAMWPAATHLQLLTALRSLSIQSDIHKYKEAHRMMQSICQLPRLQQLAWHGADKNAAVPPRAAACAPWFTCLRTLDLTHLDLHLTLSNWSPAAVETLRTAMPRLSALTLLMEFNSSQPQQASNSAVMAVLAQRTALTSLMLQLHYLRAENHNLQCLSALRLAKLQVTAAAGDEGKLEALLEAMAVQRALTCLSITVDPTADRSVWPASGGVVELSDSGVASLVQLAGSLVELELGVHQTVTSDHLCWHLAMLTRLTQLVFNAATFADTYPGSPRYDATGVIYGWSAELIHLTALSHLHSVHIVGDEQASLAREFARSCLPYLRSLKDLKLAGHWAIGDAVLNAVCRLP
jgi:hypothetical protein